MRRECGTAFDIDKLIGHLSPVLRFAIIAILLITLFNIACSDDSPKLCTGTEATVAMEPVTHFPVGTDITWSTNPPVTGSHFEHWA
jgi:hypothetical protein